MHLRAKRPVLVPYEYWAELESLSKAALMDMVWSLAGRLGESAEEEAEVIATLRAETEAILRIRKQPADNQTSEDRK